MAITLYRGLRNRNEKELIEKNRTAGGKTENPSPTAPVIMTCANMNQKKLRQENVTRPNQIRKSLQNLQNILQIQRLRNR